MGDELTISRYILMRIGELFNVLISFEPKPIPNTNGVLAQLDTTNAARIFERPAAATVCEYRRHMFFLWP